MKVIAIMGSPRKGNGYRLTQQIEQKLKAKSDIDFEYVFLKDIDFKMCKGCFTCIAKGGEHCPIQDDKKELEEKILDADGVILVSPGYVWNVSALVKNFIDRFAYTLHRPQFFDQKVMLVANGGSGVDKALKSLSFTLGGGYMVSKLCVTTTPWGQTKRYSRALERQMNKQTDKFYKAMAEDTRHISLADVIWFQLFKKMSNVSKDKIPADYDYYKDKKRYFYDTKVNPVYTAIGSFVASLAMMWMKRDIDFSK